MKKFVPEEGEIFTVLPQHRTVHQVKVRVMRVEEDGMRFFGEPIDGHAFDEKSKHFSVGDLATIHTDDPGRAAAFNAFIEASLGDGKWDGIYAPDNDIGYEGSSDGRQAPFAPESRVEEIPLYSPSVGEVVYVEPQLSTRKPQWVRVVEVNLKRHTFKSTGPRGGTFGGVGGTFNIDDITDVKNVPDAKHRSFERYRQMVKASPKPTVRDIEAEPSLFDEPSPEEIKNESAMSL